MSARVRSKRPAVRLAIGRIAGPFAVRRRHFGGHRKLAVEVVLGHAGRDRLIVENALQQFGRGGQLFEIELRPDGRRRTAWRLHAPHPTSPAQIAPPYGSGSSCFTAAISRCWISDPSFAGGANRRLGSICAGVRYTSVFCTFGAGVGVCADTRGRHAQQTRDNNRCFHRASRRTVTNGDEFLTTNVWRIAHES